jgi:tRNA(Ile)-lysidine synthetase-like protein
MVAMNNDAINWPLSGLYILAISGGADSMALLDIMANASSSHGYELVVAHFDHGLRSNSKQDRQLVEKASLRYKLPFTYTEAHLAHASEATSRDARHVWLEATRVKYHAYAVITAHHLDDLMETSILNLARGSGRRGLAPMRSKLILRPLIGLSRNQIRDYNKIHAIAWNEDPSNADITNPRNFLRHRLLHTSSPDWHSSYLKLVNEMASLNTKIDQSISTILNQNRDGESSYLFPRDFIRDLSLPELEELIMSAALSLDPDIDLDRRIVKEIALFAKSQTPHRTRSLRKNLLTTVQIDSVRVYYMGISKVGRR